MPLDRSEVKRSILNAVKLQQAGRYLVSGGLATAVHFAVLIACVEVGSIAPTLASALGFCAAIGVNYPLQYYWTFSSEGEHRATFPRYLAVTMSMLVVNTGLFWIFNSLFDVAYLAAQFVATLLTVTLNFHVNRYFTFRNRDA